MGLEVGIAAQVFIGASAKFGVVGDTQGHSAATVTLAYRAGWSFGATAGAGVLVAPGKKEVSDLSGFSVGTNVDAGRASAGMSKSLGSRGPEGPAVYTASPPVAGVGLMIGVTGEVSYTIVLPGPRTSAEGDTLLRILP
jgi:hypothetical protein